MNTKRVTSIALLGLSLIMTPAFPATVLAASADAAPAAAAGPVLSGLVADEHGQPLKNAQVEIFRYGAGLVGTAATGDDGTFTAALPASAESVYWVRAWAAGHQTATLVALPDGEISLVSLTLPSLYGQVAGQVNGPDGGAVINARVELLRPGFGVAAEAVTDAVGTFAFDTVPAGAGYTVRVQARDLAPAVLALDKIPAGGMATARVRLEAARGAVAGKLADDATGLPLPGATVLVEGEGQGLLATATAGAGGAFSVKVPAAETYRVTAVLAGYTPVTVGGLKPNAEGLLTLDGERQMRLAPAGAGVSGRLLDQYGHAVRGAVVMLEQENTGIVAEAKTAADGSFAWSGLAAGARYRVRTVPPQLTDEYGALRRWAAAESDWVSPEGGRTAAVSLSLTERITQNYGPGTVRGRVTQPGGVPAAGAKVSLLIPGSADPVATATAAADGSYAFKDVDANRPEGGMRFPSPVGSSYTLRVEQADYVTALSGPVEVTARKETLADLTLRKANATLAVRAVDQDGEPLAQAEVRLHPALGGEAVTAKTGASGVARLNSPAGRTYWVEVVSDGFRTAVGGSLTLSADQESRLDVSVRAQTGSLSGRVLDAAGRPVAGAQVAAALPDGSEVTASTAADGRYALASVPAGRPLAVRAQAEGAAGAAGSGLLTVSPGAEAHLDLTLRATTGKVTGRVLNEAGRPALGAAVELWRAGEGVVARTQTVAGGSFAFVGVAADPALGYSVRVTAPGMGYRQVGLRTPPRLFTVQPGATAFIPLVITSIK